MTNTTKDNNADDLRNTDDRVTIQQENDDVLHDYAVVKHIRDVLLKKYDPNSVMPTSRRLAERFRQVDARYKELYPRASKIIDKRVQDEMIKFLNQKVLDGDVDPDITMISDIAIKFLENRDKA